MHYEMFVTASLLSRHRRHFPLTWWKFWKVLVHNFSLVWTLFILRIFPSLSHYYLDNVFHIIDLSHLLSVLFLTDKVQALIRTKRSKCAILYTNYKTNTKGLFIITIQVLDRSSTYLEKRENKWLETSSICLERSLEKRKTRRSRKLSNIHFKYTTLGGVYFGVKNQTD